jgi:hypothetical protein
MRPYPMASVGVRRGLPKAGGRETPFGLLPALASLYRTRRSNPGAPKLTMTQWGSCALLVMLFQSNVLN